MPTTISDTRTTRGGDPGPNASVEGESVTNSSEAVTQRLPSTGSRGSTTILVLGGGLVAAGGLLLAARRRMPATVTD